MSDTLGARPSYLKAAFANVYNLSLLGGVAVASLATGDPWLLGIGLAAETLWLLFGTDNARFRRLVDARFAAEKRAEAARKMAQQAALLPNDDRNRIRQLQMRAEEVKHEAKKNDRIAGQFMDAQLGRLDALVEEFVHLALTTHGSKSYLAKSDLKKINRDRDAQRRAAQTATDETTRSLAQQNEQILEKRLAVFQELQTFVGRAESQMTLIENTIALLRDQVLTMATPEDLTSPLDSLVASVEAIRDAARAAESVVGTTSYETSGGGELREALEQAGMPAIEEPPELPQRARVRG